MTTSSITWDGITVAIRYYQHSYGKLTGHWHLELKAERKFPLPITETGYRSHFCNPSDIEAAGGLETYVEAWLEYAARQSDWIEAQADRQQLTLF